jgi:hypothetical protein
MGRPLDLIGKRFGRLTVLEKLEERKNRQVMWRCLCDCGNTDVVSTSELRFGRHSSCGCYQKERASVANKTHGESNTRLYSIWCAMIARCENKGAESYRNYGGRGISICEEWRSDFTAFRDWSLEQGYDDTLSIDRIDTNGNYEPSNCRWATRSVQMNNTRRSKRYTYRGETKTLKEWSDSEGIEYRFLKSRLARGWTIEKALTEPKRRNQFV